MPIIGFSELAELRLPPDHTVVQYLHRINDAANQAKELVQQILTFSRQVEKEHHPIQVAPIIKESLKLLRSTLPASIQIEQNIDSNCPPVMGESAQIHQVIMNLCTNAFQAMEETGGTLTVVLKQLTAADATDYPQLQLAARPYISFTVFDTGKGMNAYTRDRVLEPFFTTRKIGEATGLGLSVVHGIVKNHQGEMLINSEPGQGTEVAVFLPAVQPEPTPSNAHTHSLYAGSGTILLVDDNKTIVDVTNEMLTQFGYTVLTSTSSAEAFRIFVDNASDIDLVITDYSMPNLNGIELAQEISQLRPNLPLVLTTGYSEVIAKDFPENLKIITVLKKPVGFATLGKTMAEILAK
jgi:CheY-like chemotaxis protein